MIFSLLKNPLTKIVLNKATEHFKHKAEKVKTIRAAEIEAAKDVDITRIKRLDLDYIFCFTYHSFVFSFTL